MYVKWRAFSNFGGIHLSLPPVISQSIASPHPHSRLTSIHFRELISVVHACASLSPSLHPRRNIIIAWGVTVPFAAGASAALMALFRAVAL